MKKIINSILANLDIQIVRKSSHNKLVLSAKKFRDYEMSQAIDRSNIIDYFEALPSSKSQLRQDLFVLSELSFKKFGFFVEFGATDGIELSNTYLLETEFGWSGILAEPAKLWHARLNANRAASIETDCVWKSTDERLLFNEVQDGVHSGELSTIDSFSNHDVHRPSRKSGDKYEVSTISLSDMLKKHEAPKDIDYLSIDTEGSEFEILNAFDFDEYNIKIITCEHNYTPMRERIFELLTNRGYERKFTEFSLFDDWYVRQ